MKNYELMCNLMAVRLALFELRLYMDTHGCEAHTCELMQEYKEKYKVLLEQYESCNGAINWARDEDCRWATTPFPWVNTGCDC